MKAIIKVVVFVCLVINASFCLCFAETIKTDSKITQVTVYPNSAIINRVANLKLVTGEYQIIFPDIIPEVDENSLTIAGKGQAQVKIFGAQIKKEFLEKSPSEQVQELKEQVQGLDDKNKSLDNRVGVLKEEREFLNSIKLSAGEQIPKDLITKFPSVGELNNLVNFLVTKLQDNQNKQEEIRIEIRQLKEKKSVLERQLKDITRGTRKLQRSIVIELEVVKSGNFDLTISYLVRGVNWRPIYDARASFMQNNVELIFHGLVKQSTGESWEDVELLLSTAKPSVGGKMQELHPWYLRPHQPRRAKRGGKRSRQLATKAMDMDYKGSNVYKEELTEEEGSVSAQTAFAQAEEKGTAVVYRVKRKETIKSDGTEHKVPISSQGLSAKFEYAATPKLSMYAYLMSKVKNSKEGRLLPGRVNVFLEGDFIGTSSIPKAIGAEEEFNLYLGIDEGITVKRKKIKEKIDETLIAGILARTKMISFEYKLIVENYKSRKIKVNLYDQIPVSEHDQILIKNVKFGEEPKVKDYLDRKGVMRWEFELEPKAIKEITFSYAIEHPRKMQVQGL